MFIKKTVVYCVVFMHVFSMTAGAVDWGRVFKPGSRDGDKESGFFGVDRINEKQKQKDNFINNKNIQEADQKKIRLKDAAVKNQIEKTNKELKKTVQEIHADIQRIRQRQYQPNEVAAQFKGTVSDNEKIVYMQDGLVQRIENELVKNEQGVFVRRDTPEITYNEDNQMVSFNAEEADALGNVTVISWNGEYDEGLSVSHEVRIDPNGNKTVIEMYDAEYDSENRLTNNKQKITDKLGNISYRFYTVLSYDEHDNVTAFHERVIDAFGVSTTNDISGMVYKKNPEYQGEGDSLNAEYILTEFVEKITDGQGRVTEKHQYDIAYNDKGQITGFKEVFTGEDGKNTDITWDNAQYNEQGDLTGYQEKRIGEDGNLVATRWYDAVYKDHLLVSSEKEETNGTGDSTIIEFGWGTYNQLGQLTGFQEKRDAQSSVQELERMNMAYDSFGRIEAYREHVLDNTGTAEGFVMSGIEYDRYSGIVLYEKQEVSVFNNGISSLQKDLREADGILSRISETVHDTWPAVAERVQSNIQENISLLSEGICVPDDYTDADALHTRLMTNLSKTVELLNENLQE